MILNLLDSQSDTAARCLSLIERHAPGLMIAGGGSLSQQESEGSGREIPWQKRRKIIRLRKRTNKQSGEIAAEIGCSQISVQKICRAAGVPFVRGVARRLAVQRKAA